MVKCTLNLQKYTDMFDWNDLKFFLKLSRKGRLVHAAKSLNVEHTTVSRRIVALEKAIGAKLFKKTDKGYSLTQAGAQLLPIAEKMENSAQTVQDQISGTIKHVSGVVRIGTPDGFGSSFIAPRLPSLIKQYPDLEIDLITRPRYFSLSKREADIAITLARPKTGRVFARKLTDYQLQLFASKQYLENHGPINSKKDLKKHNLIGYVDDLIFAPELKYIDAIDRNLDIKFRSTNITGQYNAVLAGAGICVLPRFMTYDDPRLFPVLPESIRLIRSFWLLIHQDTHDLIRIRETADFITNSVRSDPTVFLEES